MNAGSTCSKYTYYFDSTNANLRDEHGYTPLHNAIINNNFEMLCILLSLDFIELEIENDGETPLLLALRLSRNYMFIHRLITGGSNLNNTNKFGRSSLHLALLYSSVDILHELIKNGADMNAQDNRKRTPLHYAVDYNNLEAVCMLLCYGADVTISCNEQITPLILAMNYNNVEIAEVLLNYYDDFSDVDLNGYTALHKAVMTNSPFAETLVKAGADVNLITFDDRDVLSMALQNGNLALFKLIWPSFDDPKNLLNSDTPPFCCLLCDLLTVDWLEVMFLLLNCSVAFELLEEVNSCGNHAYLSQILLKACNLGIRQKDHLKLISQYLSVGGKLNSFDINFIYLTYGFDEELEMLLYCGDFDREMFDMLLPQCQFIFSVIKHSNPNTIRPSFQHFYKNLHLYWRSVLKGLRGMENCIVQNLAFFSKSFYNKSDLFTESFDASIEVLEKWQKLPKIPSLVELSRNQARDCIMETFQITKPYQFHDILKRLNLPLLIKDILRFKAPLY